MRELGTQLRALHVRIIAAGGIVYLGRFSPLPASRPFGPGNLRTRLPKAELGAVQIIGESSYYCERLCGF